MALFLSATSRNIFTAAAILSVEVFGFQPYNFYPVGHNVGASPSMVAQAGVAILLNATQPVATFDYGYEVAGKPFFRVSAVQGLVQIEVKYSEPFTGLLDESSDGPYPFAIGLSNAFRVESFNVTQTGLLTAHLLQGGQRWQSIKLLTPGSIQFSQVGFEASIAPFDAVNYPGQFKSDDAVLDAVWGLGARAASAACVEAGTQTTTWDVSTHGAQIHGQRPGLSIVGEDFSDYTMDFSTKILRGGSGWAMAYPLNTLRGGILFDLVSESSGSSFVNTNTTLTPPNSLLLAYGWSFVNQTTLTSYHLETFKVPISVKEHAWYQITSALYNGTYVSVAINGISIFNVSLDNYFIGSPLSYGPKVTTLTAGAFGFGPYQDQIAVVKDVTVRDSVNRTSLYSNPLTNASDVLSEYGVQQNENSVCMDGAKRDRLVWLGDLYHTAQILGATGHLDYVKGSLQSLIDRQLDNGQFPISHGLGYSSANSEKFSDSGNFPLPDYQILGLNVFVSYIRNSNDITFAKSAWPAFTKQIQWLTNQINGTTGLLDLAGGSFLGGDKAGSAPSSALLQGLQGAVEVALAIGDSATASSYATQASSLKSAIRSKLWNAAAGVFSLDLLDPGNYSIAGIAFAITSGAATPKQARKSLSIIRDNLKLGPGYKDSSLVSSTDPTVTISPNTNGMLLAAIMAADKTAMASSLLHSLWAPMTSNVSTSTGASWEYLDLSAQPGLGLFTSLSHPWGGAPTYLITKYVAGIQQAPGLTGFGYQNWVIRPALTGYGLKNIQSQVSTPYGILQVQFNVTIVAINNTTLLSVKVVAPSNTRGIFVVPELLKMSGGEVKRDPPEHYTMVLEGASSYDFEVSI